MHNWVKELAEPMGSGVCKVRYRRDLRQTKLAGKAMMVSKIFSPMDSVARMRKKTSMAAVRARTATTTAMMSSMTPTRTRSKKRTTMKTTTTMMTRMISRAFSSTT